jgi:hypothetical protein
VKLWKQARSPTKILAEKSVYMPWLIYKHIIWINGANPKRENPALVKFPFNKLYRNFVYLKKRIKL